MNSTASRVALPPPLSQPPDINGLHALLVGLSTLPDLRSKPLAPTAAMRMQARTVGGVRIAPMVDHAPTPMQSPLVRPFLRAWLAGAY